MNKKILVFAVVLVIFTAKLFSQIPDGYYNGADGLSGEALKAALNTIIKDHTEKSYGDARYILDETDADPEVAGNILVIYSDHSISGVWDSGTTWNREHVWAKSRGIGDVSNSTTGPGSDLHNLRACLTSVNSARNNRWFAECDEPYMFNGVATGSYTSSSDWFWKPRDEDKGDVARIIFYMATRYEGTAGEPDLEPVDYIPSDKYTTEPIHALLGDLIAWHNSDPVSEFEQSRNDVIYSYQNNRNPFIDHPEFVAEIWGGNGISGAKSIAAKLYPNPTNSEVSILSDEVFNTIDVYNVIGKRIKTFSGNQKTIFVGDLQKGQYILVLNSKQNNIALPLIIID